MALDEPQGEDEVLEEKGITFLISKELLEQAKPIGVDFVHTPSGSGFRLTSALATPESACGGSCSTC